ncbi:MAG: 4-alpha-glucanotransferase [Deltaproteobacteria bacterium]|nr:4-alpha-glucanotransferase [Deltaproteobacteria bacterium]
MTQRFHLGRRAGMLLPLSCVRGKNGDIGSYTDAGAVARWLRTGGCSMWQLLPLNEVSPGQDSPYAASSSLALEPVYIDLSQVPELGGDHALTLEEQDKLTAARALRVTDFGAFREVKRSALARAFVAFKERELKTGSSRAQQFGAFREEMKSWIEEFALYRALHDRRHKSWRDWEPGLRDRDPSALTAARAELKDAIDEVVFVQWIAHGQWLAGRKAANAVGVKVLGDLPFMVAEDSADVWGLQRFFRFDATVGVPPDAYAADGQDWGLPVPRWDEMRDHGDPWLRARSDRAAALYDAFRVDHVIGLYRTYARPLAPGPGMPRPTPYFVPSEEPLQRNQGERILVLMGEKADVLAEDLGTVPDFLRSSLGGLGIPGTKVLRWEVDNGVPRDVRHFPQISLAVTGTHDAESLHDWWSALLDWEKQLQKQQEPLRGLSDGDVDAFTPRTRDALLDLAYSSSSDALLVPVIDALGWPDRINIPGTVGPHNWTWRLPWSVGGQLESATEAQDMNERLRRLAEKHARIR